MIGEDVKKNAICRIEIQRFISGGVTFEEGLKVGIRLMMEAYSL